MPNLLGRLIDDAGLMEQFYVAGMGLITHGSLVLDYIMCIYVRYYLR